MKTRTGRPRTTICDDWYEKRPPTAVMLKLAKMKNGGLTWQSMAKILSTNGESVSGSLLCQVAKGRCESERVEVALGLKPKTKRIAVCECGDVHPLGWCPKREGEPVKPPYNRKGAGKRKRPKRTPISAEVTPGQRDALHALAASEGLTWTQYCKRLADAAAMEDGDGVD
jgi:hypothetical protein